jgi:hypothetical protein
MAIDQPKRAVREKLADLCEKQAELTSEGGVSLSIRYC